MTYRGMEFTPEEIRGMFRREPMVMEAEPLSVLWMMRERPDFQDFYRFIGSYYCREFHAWIHDDRLMMDRTGKMAAKAKEWMAMKGEA